MTAMQQDALHDSKLQKPSIWFPAAFVICFTGFWFTLLATYPGCMTWDSFVMWGMGWKWGWKDWHHPFIPVLMSISRWLRGDPGIYLGFQLFLQWAGLYCIAAAARPVAGRWSLVIPLLGFSPMFLVLSSYLHKTPLQAATFTFVFGVTYFSSIRSKRMNIFLFFFTLLLLFVVVPVREFGYICAFPLLVYIFHARYKKTNFKSLFAYMMGAIIVCVLYYFASTAIVYHVLDARDCYKSQTIYRYDLAAIYATTGINYAPLSTNKHFVTRDNAAELYRNSSRLWKIYKVYDHARSKEEVEHLAKAWMTALQNQPRAWLRHKVQAFLQAIGHETYMYGFRRAGGYLTRRNVFGLEQNTNLLYDLLSGYMKITDRAFFQKPWFWILVNAAALVVIGVVSLFRKDLRKVMAPPLVLLTSSAFFYPPYFLVALDRDLRFTSWALTATVIGATLLILVLCSPKQRACSGRPEHQDASGNADNCESD